MLIALTSLAFSQPVVLSEEVARIHRSVASLEAERCEPVLQEVFDRLSVLTPADVDLEDALTDGVGTLDDLFQARIALQDRLARFQADGELTPECITGARRFDLATRYLGDHLYIAGVDAEPWLTTPSFAGPEDLRAGDILVTRGEALSSAGIAYIGRIDSQFSHNAMVHVDADGKLWTIEAYLEKGALVQPLDDFLEHGLGRIVVLRYEDPELAARGAALAYDRIANGAPIDYDEAFDGSNPGELFCSEIGPWALSLAGGPDDLPLDSTRFPQAENPQMFEALGIEVDSLAAPADLLYDPRFAILGEWRAVDHLEQMRRQDAVIESMYTWMERDGYVLDPAWANRATVDVGLWVRRTPGIGGLLSDRIHPNADRQFLVAGLAMQVAGEALYADLQDALATQPRPLTRDELLALLEEMRATDLSAWERKPRSARFHRVFHPAPQTGTL